ncbi:MAG: asparagine--tRNA ligase [Deltaproteobacteria bacterium]
MSKKLSVAELLSITASGQTVKLDGWVRTFRNNQFISMNDGSTINNIQVVIDYTKYNEDFLRRINPGTALGVEGELIESLGKGQKYEIKAEKIEIYGDCDPEIYPLQPKKHSLEFLREIAHLRFRTNTYSAIFRVRNSLSFAIHKFFFDQGFVYLHTPIITGSDAEGAGEMFKVTTIDLDNIPRDEEGKIDYRSDFFGKATNLTVSGQLEAELGAMALSKVYTFGPTFRAENSNTTRHLAEFWMIEPEIAFADIKDDMDLAEALLKYVVKFALENNADDIDFLEQRLVEEDKQKPQDQRSEMLLKEKLQFIIENDFERLTYTEAIDILMNSNQNKKKKFKYIIEKWGADLQSEHERYLVEKHFKKPVILTDYPKDIKAFYMKVNDDNKTVRAMDILFPGIGEIVGGSQREERLEVLMNRMEEMHIPVEEMQWYLDLRRFGTAPHAGFGLGFERLVQFVTGMGNIRDVIAFPRFPGSARF